MTFRRRLLGTGILSVVALCAAVARVGAAEVCPVPGYLLFGDSRLEHVSKAATQTKHLKIVVIGTASSALPGLGGADASYPGQLEAALKRRLTGIDISLATIAKPRQTAAAMSEGIEQLLTDEKPDLVIWQTGTYDAVRGVDPEVFRSSIADGVETLQNGGADVILMNMQYSPRTDTVIALGTYVDNMRWVAREREIPLFDRLAIMRHWNDIGAFNLYAATKNVDLAKRVHNCLGRALASLIIDAAHLESHENKVGE